jgi:hypothetical protein
VKLIDKGVPLPFLRILVNWYSDMSCCVVWNSIAGESFVVGCGVRQGGILSPYLFAVYIDSLIEDLRHSTFGVFIGNIFIGCVMYADDIVLMSCTCTGLQKLVNICVFYGSVWDIKFNPRKSQVTTFGGQCPTDFCIFVNDAPLIWADKIKYLGCNFICRTCTVDPKPAIGKFYASLNNILSVLGHNRNEIMAVYLVKSYCLPALLYSCETWTLNSTDLQSVNVAWNNSFRKIFNSCWRESVKPLQFYCSELPVSFLIDQRRLLFYKRLLRSDNEIINRLFNIIGNDIRSVSSKYGVSLYHNSADVIRSRIKRAFTLSNM